MKTTKPLSATLILFSLLTLTGVSSAQAQAKHKHAEDHAKVWAQITEAVAAMRPTQDNKTRGTVRFTQHGEKVRVVANIQGLVPNQKHAIHIHEFGDITSNDGTATGGHYNPEGHRHGLPRQGHRHAGDLGNLQADENGRAKLKFTVENISVAGLKNPIIGRAVIIHEKEDDGSQPVGAAGARISQGVIGIVGPTKK